MKKSRLVQALLSDLDHNSESVREAACDALSQLPEDEWGPLLDERMDAECAHLASISPDEYLQALSRDRQLLLFSRAPDPKSPGRFAEAVLKKLLNSRAASCRDFALRFLRHDDTAVRRIARRMLALSRCDRYVYELAAVLAERQLDEEEQLEILKYVGRNKEARTKITEFLADRTGDDRVTVAARNALQWIDSPPRPLLQFPMLSPLELTPLEPRPAEIEPPEVSPPPPVHELDIGDSDGWTALHFACMRDRPQEVANLLARGASATVQNKLGSQPIHFARSEKILRSLLDHGADINAADSIGNTPLHLACEAYAKSPARFHGRKEKEWIDLLVSLGAVPVVNAFGQLPEQFGQEMFRTQEAWDAKQKRLDAIKQRPASRPSHGLRRGPDGIGLFEDN